MLKFSNFMSQILHIPQKLIFYEPVALFFEKYLIRYYAYLQWKQWHKGSPEWFDHRIDLYRWPVHLNPHWVERGIYSREVMFPGCKVLDVACGDGFYPLYFYTSIAEKIDAIDVNRHAIQHAKKYHNHPRISYFRQDAIKENFPHKKYDIICFDGAFDHFNLDQLKILLPKIKKSLVNDGILVGYQELEFHEVNQEHPISFDSERELKAVFKNDFKFIKIIITNTPGRKNAYFRCSNNKRKIDRFK